jgi:hypothetical protein
MGIQLRVELPDQPGALARVTRAIARTGADVMSVAVLEAEAGRAVDDFRLRWPDGRDPAPLAAAMDLERGVTVLGCRRTRWLLDGRADLDLLTYLLAVPGRGVETLVDMAPAALDADWAELRAPSRRLSPLYTSSDTRHDSLAPQDLPVRAISGDTDAVAWAQFPLPPLRSVLVIGREGGPPFLRSEMVHGERVVALALKALGQALAAGTIVGNPSELTACLAQPQAGELQSA